MLFFSEGCRVHLSTFFFSVFVRFFFHGFQSFSGGAKISPENNPRKSPIKEPGYRVTGTNRDGRSLGVSFVVQYGCSALYGRTYPVPSPANNVKTSTWIARGPCLGQQDHRPDPSSSDQYVAHSRRQLPAVTYNARPPFSLPPDREHMAHGSEYN